MDGGFLDLIFRVSIGDGRLMGWNERDSSQHRMQRR